MRVLLLGSGGRESALAWALDRSPSVDEIVALPGNPGIGRVASLHDGDPSDPSAVVDVARRTDPDLVVVGPEAPLVAGVGDALRASGRDVFGPDAAAAKVEGSKSHAKELMDEAGIPTAPWRAFDTLEGAIAYLDELGPPYVVKADGLAAGKGVLVTDDRDAAVDTARRCLSGDLFGDAGRRIVVESYLRGEEASVIAFCDGRNVLACDPAQDYKRVGDGDVGPNTGGMGSYSPVPSCPPEVTAEVVERILRPMVSVMQKHGTPFVGALYAGLSLEADGPRVLEFNARFGDPETQALLPRLRSDIGELCLACARGEAQGMTLEWHVDACVSVVLASDGYPGRYDVGMDVHGLDDAERLDGVQVFHAGTAEIDGRIVTSGGRVMAVSALGRDIAAARRRAYEAVSVIRFENKMFRSDIALKAEEKEERRT